jgi:hypothetical protein
MIIFALFPDFIHSNLIINTWKPITLNMDSLSLSLTRSYLKILDLHLKMYYIKIIKRTRSNSSFYINSKELPKG